MSAAAEVLRSRRPSRVELHRLVDRHRAVLLARIERMLGEQSRRWGEAEDFAQLVWIEVCRKLGVVEPRDDSEFRAWITTLARRRVLDGARRREPQTLDPDASAFDRADHAPTPSQAAQRRERSDQVRRALLRLSDRHRAVVELRDFRGLSYAEAGARLGRSPNATVLLHRRALRQLRRSLRSDGVMSP